MSTTQQRITEKLITAAGFVNHGTPKRPRFYFEATPATANNSTARAVRLESQGGGWWLGVYAGASCSWSGNLGPLAGSPLLMALGVICHANGIQLAEPVGPAMRDLIRAGTQAALAICEPEAVPA